MRVRDVLIRMLQDFEAKGQEAINKAENDILYNCEDCEYLEDDPDCVEDEDEAPIERQPLGVDQILGILNEMPDYMRNAVLAEMMESHKKSK